MPVNERVQEAPVSTLRAMFAGIGRILNFTDKIRNKPATAEAPAEPDATAAAPEGSTLEDTATPETTTEPDTETPEAAVASPAETGISDAVTAAGTTVPETTVPEAAAPEAESPAAEAAPAEAKPKARSRARKPAAKPAKSEVGGHVKLVPSEESAEEPAAAEPAVAEPLAAEAPAAEAPAAETATATATAAPAAELPLANYDDLTIASLRARLRNLSVAQLGQLIEYEKSHAGRADVIAMFERRVAKIESEG